MMNENPKSKDVEDHKSERITFEDLAKKTQEAAEENVRQTRLFGKSDLRKRLRKTSRA